MSEANRYAQSKDLLYPAPAASKGFPTTISAARPQTNMAAHLQPGRHPNSCGDSRPRLSAERSSADFLSRNLPPRQHHHRLRARHHRRIRIRGRAIHVDHLPRLRRHQPHAPRHHINPLGIAQRSMRQPQRAVHLR